MKKQLTLRPSTRPPPATAAITTLVPIAGVGASSGGLEAFTELLSHLPSNTGMAFVLIQHLNPKHKSHLTQLLSATTTMPVSEVTSKTQVEANHVYVIAADRNLTLSDGSLSPIKRAKSGRNMPIDAFLIALAQQRKSAAVGVVLSGTGSDGMLGLKAIRAQSGATFAQTPTSAKFNEMPNNAIHQGVVEFILPPAGIARQLSAAAGSEPDLSPIFQILRRASSMDFTHYKHSTIRRRIRRRMSIQGIKNLRDYAGELSRNPLEALALCQDFFITVTAFFREPRLFQDLKRIAFPALLAKRKKSHKPIRIWVPGCATGEEAYSIAICLTEFLEGAGVRLGFQIFATDANEAVIDKARAGVYSAAAVAAIPSRRRARFFTKTDGGYLINKTIRDACVFARQNLAQDPPLSRLDLISCCNVLIYLEPELQNRILPVFHYALGANGFLVLGSSESIGVFTELFQPATERGKLYRRLDRRGGALLPGRWELTTPSRRASRPKALAVPVPLLKIDRVEATDMVGLRKELAATKKYLRSLIASKEAALQELRSVNEEAQAGNQELETAQEELQSVNQELNTLNEDLRVRNEQLGELNLDLANLQESISIPLVMVGKDLRIRRFTRAMMPLLNLTASDIGRPLTDLHAEIALPDLRKRLMEVMAGHPTKPLDAQSPDGRWYSRRCLPAIGAHGKIDGAIFMLIDIDAEKRGRDFAEAIVEAVHEPLLILRKNLEVVAANRAFYHMFRVSPEETEGRLIFDLGDGQWNIPRLHELLHQVLPAHATFRNFEVEHNFEGLGRKVMLLNASEVFDANAGQQTILLAIEDITERKQADEKLLKMNVELQHFAYALTHDLREPLRMVVNFTELLALEYGGRLGAEADQYIEYSVEGARRMEALMKALLAYWESSAVESAAVPTDCNVALGKTVRNLEAAIAESGASITSDLLPTVPAEEAMLMQLFQNLIANSIKYRSQDSPRIHISAENGGPAWTFSVRDNGLGIDAQYLDRIFGIFKRLHGKEIPGTGIGLALCKKIVERRGGKIWAESSPGVGSVFKFTIPVQPLARHE